MISSKYRTGLIRSCLLAIYPRKVFQIFLAILDIFEKPPVKDVDTVTLYIGPQKQPDYYDYIINMKPKRIIFNPGTENDDFEKMAEAKGIEALQACTLVMLRSGQY